MVCLQYTLSIGNAQEGDYPISTPTAIVPTSVYAPILGTTDFNDSFDNEQPGLSWSTGNGGSYKLDSGELWVNALPWDKSRNWKTHVVSGPDSRNAYICKECSIQTDMRFPNIGETTDEPRGGGIVFGYNDSRDFYQFLVTGEDGKFTTWAVLKGPTGNDTTLTTVSPARLLIGSWTDNESDLANPYAAWGSTFPSGTLTLRVDLQIKSDGSEKYGWANFYVNGERIGNVKLSDYIGGQVGLVTAGSAERGGTMIFDNFVVAMLSIEDTSQRLGDEYAPN